MSQVTISELTALVWREQERRRGKVIAFTPVSGSTFRNDETAGRWQIGVAILGENGYALPAVPMLHNSYEGAAAMADTLNNLLGHAAETSAAIVADTMHRSRMIQRERDKSNGITFFEVRIETDKPITDEDEACILISDMLQEELRFHDETRPVHVETHSA